MSISEVSGRLKEFGFTEFEAEIYVFLSALGPTPARVVARRFSISRMKAYRTLKELEERGMVNRIMGRPYKFVAEPIDKVLKQQIESIRERLSHLVENEEKIKEDLDRLSNVEPSILEEPRFRIYQGRQQVYELLTQMCERVIKEIFIVTTSSELLRFSFWGIDNRLKNLTQKGTKVRLLSQVDDSNIKEVEELMESIEIRHIILPSPVRFVTIDDNENLTSVAMDDSMSMTTQEDTGLWTNAPSFTSVMKVFYEALWSMAPEANVIINAIRTGEMPQEFTNIRSFEEYSQRYSNMIKNAEKTVDIIVKRIQDLSLPIRDVIIAGHGRIMRILTIIDESQSETLSQIMKTAEVRHLSTDTNLSLLIVDNRESILTTSSQSSSTQAVWSNLEAYVETMTLVFKDFWRNASPAQMRYLELMNQQNKEEITQILYDSLQQNGWTVKVPGNLSGITGINYTFDLIAENEIETIGLNINLGEDAFNQVFELSARKMDLSKSTIALASIKPLEEEVKRLAELYGIKLIQADDAINLTNSILKISNN
jgi:sugar-specific transcriptional regulator TrmB